MVHVHTQAWSTVAMATAELSLLCRSPLVSAGHCSSVQTVSALSTSSASHHHGYQAPPPRLTPLVAFPAAHFPSRDFPPSLREGTACISNHTFQLFQQITQQSVTHTAYVGIQQSSHVGLDTIHIKYIHKRLYIL